ncbi:MAG: hypothetical protein KGJ80_18995 [Chloroflexota bacterium]|nr:hypothetical protein [Chloroflexota bacterium]
MKTLYVVIGALVLVMVAGGGGFFAGTSYGQAQAQNIRADFFRQRSGNQANASGQGSQAGQFGGRPAAVGTLKSVQGDTITVTQNDGTIVTVNVNAQTVIQKTVTGTLGDLQAGERVTVLSDQTGSNVTAQTVQIRPSTQ